MNQSRQGRCKKQHRSARSWELAWDLEVFCREQKPVEMHRIAQWFSDSVSNPAYQGKGATTIALLRFHHQTGAIDGLSVGDSPVLLAVRTNGAIQAQVLAPLHIVANDPGAITRQWRYGLKLEVTVFECGLPQPAHQVYLVTMSDGYTKLSDRDTLRLMHDDLLDATAAEFFPYFTKVYPPQAILEKYPPEQRRSAVMPLLYLAQRTRNYLLPQDIADIERLDKIYERRHQRETTS